MTKQIELTQNQVAIVDDWNYEYLNQWKWRAQWSDHTHSYYALRSDYSSGNSKAIIMTRKIMKTTDDMICDHINHDTLDNREENLRNVTYSQNGMNKRTSRNNKLGEKNIHRHGSGFEVKVRKGGRMMFDKTFRTLDEAIVARNEATSKYHGEFAKRNND